MPIKRSKPTSPARRYYEVLDYSGLSKVAPHAPLVEHQVSTGARNNQGRTTSRFRGGPGHSARTKRRPRCRGLTRVIGR